jgi:hypothetical protein
MNIVQLQEALKDFSDDQLVREMQMPSGQAPQYLVLTELERREKSRQRYQQQQQPQQSVAEETLMTRMQGGIARWHLRGCRVCHNLCHNKVQMHLLQWRLQCNSQCKWLRAV